MSLQDAIAGAFGAFSLMLAVDTATVWGGWTMRHYLRKRRQRLHPYSWIEPRVKPLVDAMNSTGVMETIASCEGHYLRDISPYVYFKAPVVLAAALERTLRPETDKPADPRLHYFWTLDGGFNGEYEPSFCIRAPKLDRSMPFRRKWVDHDLLVLADIVKELGNASISPP